MSELQGKNTFFSVTKSADLSVAVGLIGILVLMVMPLPAFIIDIFLALSIGGSILLLLTAVYARRPLDFSVLPSILLTATLFRLALNVASTRLVLLNGPTEGAAAAGNIIQSFGEFVVGGNYAVGIIIFIILVIINFVVITKGAGRVAEVAARFTLDAMPGKQMAIDADLNAGAISEKEAKERRETISKEADFYGAMDGASKFVRGDAIAGILIVLVNIVGGIIIGTIQNGMSISDAASVFVLLTVGDGLVTQIPALIISTAAGIVVTHASGSQDLGGEVRSQMMSQPKSLAIASLVMAFIGLIPGLPAFPFLFISGCLAYIFHRVTKSKRKEEEMKLQRESMEQEKSAENKIEKLLAMDVLELEVGYGLVNIVDPDQGGELLSRINQIRRQFALEFGIIIPSLRIRDNLQLNPGEYNFILKGVSCGRADLVTDHLLAMDPGSVVESVPGIDTKEPAFGLPAIWINPNNKELAQMNGYTVVDISTVIATHITELLRKHLYTLLGRQELQTLLDGIKEEYPKVVEDLIPGILPVGTILKVLQNLLHEGVPIRDLRTILEILADEGASSKDVILLTERVRCGLQRTICSRLVNEDKEIHILTLERQIEENIANSIIKTESGVEISPDPDFVQKLLGALNVDVARSIEEYSQSIVLCSPSVRYHLKKLIERFIPNLIVLSHDEISPEVNLKSIGIVRLNNASQEI